MDKERLIEHDIGYSEEKMDRDMESVDQNKTSKVLSNPKFAKKNRK